MKVLNIAHGMGTFARCLALAVFFGVTFTAPAQEASPEETQPTEPADAPTRQVGDVLELKSGKELVGQVRGQGAGHYLLEVIPGVVIQVPRAQVQRVTFDDRDAVGQRGGADGSSTDGARTVVESSRVSTDLNRRLYRALGEGDASEYKDQPVADIIENLSQRSGVTIELDRAFRDLPVEEQRWTVRVEPDTSLYDFLTGQFQEKYPKASIEFQFDRIVVGWDKPGEEENGAGPNEEDAP